MVVQAASLPSRAPRSAYAKRSPVTALGTGVESAFTLGSCIVGRSARTPGASTVAYLNEARPRASGRIGQGLAGGYVRSRGPGPPRARASSCPQSVEDRDQGPLDFLACGAGVVG